MNKETKKELAREYLNYLKEVGTNELNESITIKLAKSLFNPCYYELIQYRWIPLATFNVEGNMVELNLEDYLNSELFY